MNYIKHLTGFFDKVMRDDRLNPTHISLYISLFQYWNIQRFKNPISISRDEVMRVSKIYSKATYHKCMKDLHNFSYLQYEPSFNPFRGSLVTLFNLELTSEQVQKKARRQSVSSTGLKQPLNKHQTSAEQALVPSINNTNIINSLNNSKESVKALTQTSINFSNSNSEKKVTNGNKKQFQKSSGAQKENSCRQKSSVSNTLANNDQHSQQASGNSSHSRSEDNPGLQSQNGVSHQTNNTKRPILSTGQGQPGPIYEEVEAWFTQNIWPALEAQKFFSHYESNGWLIGGKTPMKNWKAAAKKWMLNSLNFSPLQNSTPLLGDGRKLNTSKLHTTNNKNYNEPL